MLGAFAVVAMNTFHLVDRSRQRISFAKQNFASFWSLYLFLCDAQSNDVDDGGIGIGDICMN